MRIVFWQAIPSFHQSAYIRALAARHVGEIILVIQEALPDAFVKSGWSVPDFTPARVVQPNDSAGMAEAMSVTTQDAVHIFSGLKLATVRRAFLRIVPTNATIGLISEAADGRGLIGLARRLRYSADLVRFRSRIAFVLAMGRQGVEWYSSCGTPAEKVFPFAYVAEWQSDSSRPDTSPRSCSPDNEMIRILFTGQCIKRKGIDVLLAALAQLGSANWRLDVVGDGPERGALMRVARDAGVAAKVVFHGALPNVAARSLIRDADFCVLPSRWDGWGVVVNEALMAGVPVICTDRCGAADLLQHPERGQVVRAGSVEHLQQALACWIRKGKRSRESTLRLEAWAECIGGDAVARYLLDVIQCAAGTSPRPQAPWCSDDDKAVRPTPRVR